MVRIVPNSRITGGGRRAGLPQGKPDQEENGENREDEEEKSNGKRPAIKPG